MWRETDFKELVHAIMRLACPSSAGQQAQRRSEVQPSHLLAEPLLP
jgi:hypothetical protein